MRDRADRYALLVSFKEKRNKLSMAFSNSERENIDHLIKVRTENVPLRKIDRLIDCYSGKSEKNLLRNVVNDMSSIEFLAFGYLDRSAIYSIKRNEYLLSDSVD